jgi:hypothetical protein
MEEINKELELERETNKELKMEVQEKDRKIEKDAMMIDNMQQELVKIKMEKV